jgi:VanZ family protein
MPRAKSLLHRVHDSRPFAWGLAVTVALILYGSFYPFAFHNHVDPIAGVRQLLATWKQRGSLGDVLANILLYLPFGFFAAKALPPRLPLPLRVLTCLLAGAALSLCVEFTQLYDAGREAAMSDVYANSAGALLGAMAGAALSADLRLAGWNQLRRRPFAALLICCWIAYRLFPYVPVIDAHKYWHAVRPILYGSSPMFSDVLRHFASWLAVGALLEAIWRPERFAMPALMLAIFCGRIGIADIALSRAEVIGGLAAAAIWVAWLHAARPRRPILAAALAVAILVEALQPFRFLTVARPFDWVPFWGFIQGSIWTAVPSLLSKFFLYGTLVWSLSRSGLRWTAATAAAAVFVFVVHYLQVYLPGRSAEITDSLLVLVAGGLMRTLDHQ